MVVCQRVVIHQETITNSDSSQKETFGGVARDLLNDFKIIHEPGNFLGKTRRWWNDGYNKFDMSGYTLLGVGFGLRLWSFLETEEMSFSRLIEPGQCYLTLGKKTTFNKFFSSLMIMDHNLW